MTTRSLDEAMHGQIVQVVGRIEASAAPLTAPITGRSCVWFEVVVEEMFAGPLINVSRPRDHEQQARAFFVVDETGRALVEPGELKVVLTTARTIRRGTFDDATDAMKAHLARRKLGLDAIAAFRYTEAALEIGDEIAVIGRVRFESDPEPRAGYRATAHRIVIEAPSAAEPIVVHAAP